MGATYFFESNEPLSDEDAARHIQQAITRCFVDLQNVHINDAVHHLLAIGGRLRSLSGKTKDELHVLFSTHDRVLCEVALHTFRFRMLLPRLAMICHEQKIEVSLYGGEATFVSPVGHPETVTFRLAFTNTPACQEFTLEAVEQT